MANDDFFRQLHASGFSSPVSVAGLAGVEDLFPERACGIYVLHQPAWKEKPAYYIGQTIDFRDRFRQHLRGRFPRIEAVSFLSANKDSLDELELTFIERFRRFTFLLNVRYANPPLEGQSPFDAIMSRAARERWLTTIEDPVSLSELGVRNVDEAHRERYRTLFDKFASRPDHGWATLGLALYVAFGIPMPYTTERNYWAVSCLSQKYVTARINIYWHEVAAAIEPEAGGDPEFVFCLASDVIEPELERILAEHPMVAVDDRRYPSGNPNQMFLWCQDLFALFFVITEPIVARAIRRYNLDLMRRGRTPQTIRDSHCYYLADHLLEQDYEAALARFLASVERVNGDVAAAKEFIAMGAPLEEPGAGR